MNMTAKAVFLLIKNKGKLGHQGKILIMSALRMC